MEDVVEISSDSSDTIIYPDGENVDNLYGKLNDAKENMELVETNTTEKDLLYQIPEKVTYTNEYDADNVLKELYAKYLPKKCKDGSNIHNELDSTANLKRKYTNELGTVQNLDNLYALTALDSKEKPVENIDNGKLNNAEENMELVETNTTENDILNQIPEKVTYTNKYEADNILKELYAKYLPKKCKDGINNHNELDSTANLKRKYTDELGTVENHSTQNFTKKEMMEVKKNKRKLAQQNKKILLEKEKETKRTLKQIQKSINPDECLKNIIVRIDETLITECGEGVIEQLNSNNISYTFLKQKCNCLISWVRKIQTLENLVLDNPVKDEQHFLLVLPSSEFKSLVHKNCLITHIHSISLQLQFHHLTIAIFGLDKLSDEEEYAIMECEIHFKCYWQCVKKLDQLGSLIYTVTKAVAQIPYKLEKQKKMELQNEFFADTNKDTVRVDKNGNGLSRLWKQMLTMLPLARLETAEAISTAYPTPSALFTAYENCEYDKEELLQNLPVKRTNGPLTNSRKLGPELSKKCANFFTATENMNI